ncbi:Beta-mannosyltransferase 1 [Lithohypha guttulata]|uniref:Beta-mannosyltransferase 1 n=1 Tax=Lithohypha guttulata TaxID=1690604 RepID=A0AAN7T312_9EURO|nr:Beta-mannosyltransferase 1 [Lithohypha guttulata]KAK5095320.1 Beta-mannosyltransferase 1 [Lithohypha guttulata]
MQSLPHTWRASEPASDSHEPYELLETYGYSNTRIPDGPHCDDILVPGQELRISKSIYLEDDNLEIAETIVHPMVDYTGQPKDLSFKEIVEKTWGAMAGSSVWLEKYQVYFSVTRVFFYTQGVKHWPKISFLYAQIYDPSWTKLDNFTISWQGESIVFPRVLDVEAEYEIGGGFYGPEDPRVIIEQGVQDAEPIVVFNMLQLRDKVRSMYVHRPFSNFTTNLKFSGKANTGTQKNWSPFFMPRNYTDSIDNQRWPSKHINFIFDWHPLKITRCHLLNGNCDFVYSQDQSGIKYSDHVAMNKYNDTQSAMRGGSNFEPLGISPGPGLTSFVGFPRTHTDAGCGKEAIYRPVVAIMTTNGTHFYLDYMSSGLDFGHSVLTEAQYNDVCDKGRILLTNSIAKLDPRPQHDTLTLSMTVADSTVQVANLRGVGNLVSNLPQFNLNKTAAWHNEAVQAFRLNVTHDVLVCAVQTISDYAIRFTNVTDRTITT